jgi:hypothetical protein
MKCCVSADCQRRRVATPRRFANGCSALAHRPSPLREFAAQQQAFLRFLAICNEGNENESSGFFIARLPAILLAVSGI